MLLGSAETKLRGRRGGRIRIRGAVKTLKGFARLLVELPLPVRTALLLGYSVFLAGFLASMVTGQLRIGLATAVLSGAAFAVAGWCVFRNVRGAAAVWLGIYCETRGIPPERSTVADMSNVRSLGFFYMVFGCFFMAGAAWTFIVG